MGETATSRFGRGRDEKPGKGSDVHESQWMNVHTDYLPPHLIFEITLASTLHLKFIYVYSLIYNLIKLYGPEIRNLH